MVTSIELRNLTTGYHDHSGDKVIERDISAEINSGEYTCLLGPNGAGKTTLLRTLSGFIPPLSGEILINGLDIRSFSEQELSKLLSVVLTDKPSVTSMTVEQLIALGRSPYTGFWGRLTEKDKKVIEEAMDMTGTFSMRNRRVNTLSDGERQKVMIAKSLAQETSIIFLDEPTAFLDFPSKAETMRLLKKLAKQHNRIIFQSTHDLNMALALADRIWLVDKELGVHIGTPNELAASQELQKYFLREGISFNSDNLQFTIDEF